jgi:hypothetical protein
MRLITTKRHTNTAGAHVRLRAAATLVCMCLVQLTTTNYSHEVEGCGDFGLNHCLSGSLSRIVHPVSWQGLGFRVWDSGLGFGV